MLKAGNSLDRPQIIFLYNFWFLKLGIRVFLLQSRKLHAQVSVFISIHYLYLPFFLTVSFLACFGIQSYIWASDEM
jgi:hypothetical protein